MKVSMLLNEERIDKRADLAVEFTHDDLTQVTAAAAQTLTPFSVKADYQGVECVSCEIKEPFEDTADAAFNDVQVQIGDAGSANRFLSTTQINRNGTEIYNKPGTGTTLVPVADTPVLIAVASMAAKSLVNLNRGKAVAYFRIRDSRSQN